jgi:stearoyl-CoA desaturase (delta-9 desaturase)
MIIKQKFISQQILTSLGIIGLIFIFIDSVYKNSWGLLFWSFLYSNLVVSLLCAQIILHRYFAHRSFTSNKITNIILTILSILPGQGSPIAWAAAHRHHHKYADKELDNHSPKESYFLAAGGWLLKGYSWVVEQKKLKTIPTDLMRDKLIITIDKYYYYIWLAIICISILIDPIFGFYFVIAPIGWALVIAAFVTLGCHAKFFGNYRSYETNDDSYNNMIFQFIVLGDALHNNHHNNPTLSNLKLKKFEFDPAGLIINLLKKK